MGNETSSNHGIESPHKDSLNGNSNSSQPQRRFAPKKKRILVDANRRTDSMDSDCGSISISGTAAKAVSRKTSQQRQQQLQPKPESYPNLSAAATGLSASTQHLLVPDFDGPHLYFNNNPPGARKGSCSDVQNMVVMSSLEAPNANNRRRSRSLCSQQMKNDCQSVQQQNSQGNNNNSGTASRRSSNGTLPSLTRLRIQQCFKHAKPTIGQQILKRACTLRSEMKTFLAYLNEDKVEELSQELHNFVTDCVNNIENAECITEISRQFGRMHVQLCNYGFRPEYFSIVADATIAECVRLDGGNHIKDVRLCWPGRN
ncbi:hypothetical protein M3Y97_00927900 [Aphelenchoides bicaudatus]|nr:hypothetical protein M3Y97_00927900 [Aphelenchoides bicaudatus]